MQMLVTNGRSKLIDKGIRYAVSVVLLGLVIGLWNSGHAFANEEGVFLHPPEKPMAPRLGFMSLNRYLDNTKPLAISDGAGFVYNSGMVIGGIDSRWVGGMSLTNKKMLWWYDGSSTMSAPPGSFGSNVVLGFRDGYIVKLDALTGKVAWKTRLDSFNERGFILNGTTLYVVTAAQVINAVDYQTGQPIWLFDAGFPEGMAISAHSKPIVYSGQVIFGIANGEIIAVSAETGKLVWRYNPSYIEARFHDFVGDFFIRGQKLILARYDGFVGAVDLNTTRDVAWQQTLPGLSSANVRGNRIFLGGVNGDVYALDLDNGGKRLWRAVTGSTVSSITIGESALIVAGSQGLITSLDVNDGHMLWYDFLGASLDSSPFQVDTGLFFSTSFKSLYAYKIQ